MSKTFASEKQHFQIAGISENQKLIKIEILNEWKQ